MLLIISILILFILCFIICYFDSKYWHTDYLEIVGGVFGCLSGIAFFITVCLLIGTLCSAPATQASYEERYNKLMQKVEHIDSFNREEVIEQVDEWNKNYRTNIYARKSPWVGWFYTIDTSTTSLIELEDCKNG